MKRTSFLRVIFSCFVVVGALGVHGNAFAACREVTCAASCGAQEVEVTNSCKAEKGCTQKACIPNSFVSGCPNFNTQCAVSCSGIDDATCANVVCPTGTKYCKASDNSARCTYNGQSGNCIGESEVCNGTAGKGTCTDNDTTCCVSSTTTTCTGGSCKAACATGETEDTTCSASQCASQSTNKKYCKTGGGTTTPAAKCDPEKFKEYAGVCFPLNTGLSETPVSAIVINLMKWLLYLFGFLAIIAFVISGIQYLSAAGNMNMIETAKRNMTWSIVGVVVALSGLVLLTAIDALLRATAWGG